MGMDFSVFCGPAAICTAGKILVKKSKEGICLKCNPHNDLLTHVPTNGVNRFCTRCGGPLEDITFHSVGTQNRSQVQEEIDYALSAGSYYEDNDPEHVYVPNERRGSPRGFSSGANETNGVIATLTPDVITNECAWFASAYLPELSKLRELYGIDNVRIQFVVLGSWS